MCLFDFDHYLAKIERCFRERSKFNPNELRGRQKSHAQSNEKPSHALILKGQALYVLKIGKNQSSTKLTGQRQAVV